MSEEDDAKEKLTYAVGYGKPPTATRFKKGQSGNPSGRPKAVKSFEEIIYDQMNSKMGVVQDGRRKRMPRREVVATDQMNRSLKGDRHAVKMVLEADARAQARREAQGHATARELAMDAQVYEAMLVRFGVEDGEGEV